MSNHKKTSPLEIPELTPLQFFVMSLLGTNRRAGHELIALLTKAGHRKSRPAAYMLFARMEESGWLESEWHEKTLVDDEGVEHTVREKRFKVTGEGSAAWAQTQRFFADARLAGGAS